MSVISDSEIKFILISIFLLLMYFDQRYKGFLALSIWLFVMSALNIFLILENQTKVLIFIISIIPVSIYALIEAEKLKKRGIVFEINSKKHIIRLVILGSIYILLKIFYLDMK